MSGEQVGRVMRYFGKVGVAVIEIQAGEIGRASCRERV